MGDALDVMRPGSFWFGAEASDKVKKKPGVVGDANHSKLAQGDAYVGSADGPVKVETGLSSLGGLTATPGNVLSRRFLTQLETRGFVEGLETIARETFRNSTTVLQQAYQKPLMTFGPKTSLDDFRDFKDGAGVHAQIFYHPDFRTDAQALAQKLKAKYPKITTRLLQPEKSSDVTEALEKQTADRFGINVFAMHGGQAEIDGKTINAITAGKEGITGGMLAESAGKNPLKQLMWMQGCYGNEIARDIPQEKPAAPATSPTPPKDRP